MLEIYAISYNGQPPAAGVRARFGAEGGTLGRNSDNHMVLPDPARHVSRLQARIRVDAGRFLIANISNGNPMFCNDQELEYGRELALATGDELRIGLYVLGVNVLEAPAAPAATGVVAPAAAEPPVLRPVVTVAPSAGAATRSDAFPAGVAGLVPPAAVPAGSSGGEVVDPLALLGGGAAGGGTAGVDPFAEFLGGAPAASSAGAALAPAATSVGAVPAPPATSVGAALASALAPLGREPAANPLAEADRLPAARQPEPARPALAGDPFADLLGPPSSHAIADLLAPDGAGSPGDARSGAGLASLQSVPAGGTQVPAAPLLPDDFEVWAPEPERNPENPLPKAGVASSLADLDLGELGPDPRAASIVDFPVGGRPAPDDPLQGSAAGMVDTGEIDPLKIFAGGAGDGVLASVPTGLAPDLRLGGADGAGGPLDALAIPAGPPRVAPDVARVPNALAASIPVAPAVPVAPPVQSPAPVRVAAAPAQPSPAPMPLGVAPRVPASGPASGSTAATASADPDVLLAALLRGARVEGFVASARLTPELMELLGSLVYQATAGIMELMAARQIMKREIGSEVTMIIPDGNNPLKVLPSPEAAVAQMLGPRIRGFMPPRQAMDEAFDDLRAHEVGFIAGIRAAMAKALLQFEPGALERRFGAAGVLDSVLPMKREARLWSLFEQKFKEMYKEVQEDSQVLFSDAFVTAYEEQVEQQKATRERR